MTAGTDAMRGGSPRPRTPFKASSWEIAVERVSRPDLATAYAAVRASLAPAKADSEEKKTALPRPFLKRGIALRAVRKAVLRLIVSCRSQSPRAVSATGPVTAKPPAR